MIEKIKNIAQLISSQGGTSMLIGGAVIDSILGLPIKDIDIEVYGLSLQEVESLLESNGIPTNMVGKSFGVIKVVSNDVEFDISIPRRENKSGFGHNHFEISLDHNMSPKEAGLRRDLTINSMYQNILTGEIIDPYNGLQDLKDGVIRATNTVTFKEDPLRVLRIMQLLPRKGKFVHPDTIKLCQDMFHEFTHLPKERVFAEFEKLLLKDDKPSKGLEFLKECGWISHFPELEDLIGCQQHPEWHPEGDVWIHTCMVLDNAAQLRQNVPDELKLSYMFSALLHDIGKPGTTDIHLKSPGHDLHGAKLVSSFFLKITNDASLIENVTNLVALHMLPGQLCQSDARIPAWRRLHNKFRLDVLGWLCKADSAGRTGRSLEDIHNPSELCFKYCLEFGTDKIHPVVMGRDLINLGMQPGTAFRKILAYAYELQLDGLTKEEILDLVKENEKKWLS